MNTQRPPKKAARLVYLIPTLFPRLLVSSPTGCPSQIGTKRMSLPSNGYSGTAIRPIILAGVCKIRSAFPPKELGLLGIGGIESADTALQYIHAGAQAVQVCSAVQSYSYEMVDELKCGLQFLLYCNSTPRLRAFLEQYAEQKMMPFLDNINWCTLSNEQDKKVPTITQRCGIVSDHLVNRDQIQHVNTWSCKAKINQSLCLNCGTCATSCRDNGAHAFIIENGKLQVKEEWCVGCMLCATVCPTHAIDMVKATPQPKYKYHTDEGHFGLH